ncbi:alpha/beta hydrolase [Actinomadura barringtoniae]|uniref:Alpha/beta hydrolase n=1 Tax=Actinomadura barringtoniae TaxID=1427535 RepID=A0A939PF95_9ACTN|nr:alpha/beta hydrolase [Actinomadura barringtoniae]MBO2451213.1 alpha/beta hydrolase [Actinomadura barringtoniae]
MSTLHSVESRDGTVIGFETLGQGSPLLLVHGTTADRTRWTPVLDALTARFTVHVVDRRGRGLSTAEQGPYALRREGEDIAAVAETIGQDVYLVGHSYGALCSLEAALLTSSITRMFLYEPPTDGRSIVSTEARDKVRKVAAAGNAEATLEALFREALGTPPPAVQAMKASPTWLARLATAPTVMRELDGVETFDILDRLGQITVPVRLLLGTESPPYFRSAAETIAAHLPNADLATLHGQAHLGVDGDPAQFTAAVFAFIDQL